jgi:hypothetical protein
MELSWITMHKVLTPIQARILGLAPAPTTLSSKAHHCLAGLHETASRAHRALSASCEDPNCTVQAGGAPFASHCKPMPCHRKGWAVCVSALRSSAA